MPVFTPALDLILNLADKSLAGRLALAGSRLVPVVASSAPGKAIRTAEAYARVRACLPSSSGFVDVDLAPAAVRLSIGEPDQVPASGTFPLAPRDPQTVGPLVPGRRYFIAQFLAGDDFANVGAALNATGVTFTATGAAPSQWTHGSALQEITVDLSVTATYAEVQAALNATSYLTALGGVSVVSLGKGAYKITFAAFGPQTAIAGPINAGMSPLSVVSVARAQPGTDRLHEVQIIRLLAYPAAFALLATPFPVAAAQVVEVQSIASDRPAVKDLVLDPEPYGGDWLLTVNGRKAVLPFDATAERVQSLAGTSVFVSKRAANVWRFTASEVNKPIELASDLTNLIVPKGVTGPISLNTPGIFELFAATTAKFLKLTLEVKIAFPGQAAHSYQGAIELWRDLFNEGTLVPPTLQGLQFVASNLAGTPFVYTNEITALRGGAFSLESVDTSALQLDTLYLFPVGGTVNSFWLKAGPADPDDPTGQVAPLADDTRHWERAGL